MGGTLRGTCRVYEGTWPLQRPIEFSREPPIGCLGEMPTTSIQERDHDEGSLQQVTCLGLRVGPS